MKNLELLSTEKSVQDEIRTSRDKLLAYAGIKVDILDLKNDILRVRVEQATLKNNWMLSQRQLVGRAGTVLAALKGKYRLHFVALSYKPKFEEIDHHWIAYHLKVYNLSKRDLCKQLGLETDELIQLLSGSSTLTLLQQVTFYYYFKTYELNKAFRSNDISEC